MNVTSDFTWRLHIPDIIVRTKCLLDLIGSSRCHLAKLYNSTFLSHLNYYRSIRDPALTILIKDVRKCTISCSEDSLKMLVAVTTHKSSHFGQVHQKDAFSISSDSAERFCWENQLSSILNPTLVLPFHMRIQFFIT